MSYAKKSLWLLIITGLFLIAACSGDNGPAGKAVMTINPGQSATIKLDEAEVYFPADAVQESVDVTLLINRNVSGLPQNIHPITSIYNISFSDPSAYGTDEDEATVRFSFSSSGRPVVYYSSDGMQSWEDWGGIQRSQSSVEVIMPPGSTGDFVVGEAPLLGSSSHMRKGPYLMLTGKNTEMQVLWQTSSRVPSATLSWVRHDSSDNPSSVVVEPGSDNTYRYVVTSLIPSTRYDYTVSFSSSEQYSGQFMSAPPDDKPDTTFYAYGDTRTQPKVHNDVVHVLRHDAVDNGMEDVRQTFVLHTGDFVHRGLDESYWDNDYFHYRDYVSTNEFLASFPIMPAVGNHEFKNNDGGYSMNPGLFYKYWYSPLYPPPDQNGQKSFYYSFDYGPVHISVIDPYTVPYKPGDAQYEWLKSDLENTTKRWKIVACHHPFYDAGNGSPKGDVGNYADTRTLQQYLQPLLEANNVKLVLQGHRHYYSRSTVNGITYLVLGDGGAPKTPPVARYNLPSYDVPYDNAVEGYHFARIDVTPSNMTVSVIQVHDAEPYIVETVTIAP